MMDLKRFRPMSYQIICHIFLRNNTFLTQWKHLGSALSNLISCVTLGNSVNLFEFNFCLGIWESDPCETALRIK